MLTEIGFLATLFYTVQIGVIVVVSLAMISLAIGVALGVGMIAMKLIDRLEVWR